MPQERIECLRNPTTAPVIIICQINCLSKGGQASIHYVPYVAVDCVGMNYWYDFPRYFIRVFIGCQEHTDL